MLKNKVAIVTGGGSGLGEAACKLFAKNSAKVVVADWNFESAQRVADEINETGGIAIALRVNVADRESVNDMVWHVMHTYGQIDILTNNAGITADKTLAKMTDEMFDRVIDVNLKGVYNVTRAVVPYMIKANYGKIINTSSVVRNGNVGQTNYSASKAAVAAMTRTWALELAKKGILVNAVAPGFMRTPMTAGMNQEALNATESKIPLGHLGDPEDIAEAYLWLASDKTKYITGTVLEVTGGLIV